VKKVLLAAATSSWNVREVCRRVKKYIYKVPLSLFLLIISRGGAFFRLLQQYCLFPRLEVRKVEREVFGWSNHDIESNGLEWLPKSVFFCDFGKKKVQLFLAILQILTNDLETIVQIGINRFQVSINSAVTKFRCFFFDFFSFDNYKSGTDFFGGVSQILS
jgi:hypothetical protein